VDSFHSILNTLKNFACRGVSLTSATRSEKTGSRGNPPILSISQIDLLVHTSCLPECMVVKAAGEDINIHNRHTATKLKMVSLYTLILHSFKDKGHCVVMDSAYTGDAMCQVG
jgi:hypothetical protein